MSKFWLIALVFLLSGCGENHCIKPESLSNLREKLNVVSTEQKWVESSVYISDRITVTEIDIVPSKINFCPNQDKKDFVVKNDGSVPVSTIDFVALGLNDGNPIAVINEQLSYLWELRREAYSNWSNQEYVLKQFENFKNTTSSRISYCFEKDWYANGVRDAKNSTKWSTWKDVPLRVNDSSQDPYRYLRLIDGHINACQRNKRHFEGFAKQTVSLPFELKKGDTISFSVVEKKMCENDETNEKRYITTDEKCGEHETEYFAKTLNQEECQGDICPNRYTIGNAEWLNGKEYWSSNFLKSDKDKKKSEIIDVIKFLKDNNGDCSKLSDDHKSKVDTYILNSMCNKVCHFKAKDCVQVEGLDLISGMHDYNDMRDEEGDHDEENNKIRFAKTLIREVESGAQSNVPLLRITMRDEDFEHLQGGIRTNYNHKVEKDYPQGENLIFTFGYAGGKGGYNMRVTKNHSLADNLYIHVSDKLPEHKAGENQADIPVDISRIHDVQYMENLRDKLKDKTGYIYYGIKDHGCDYKNEGKFNINLTIKEPPVKTFSAIYHFFDEKVKTAFFGSSYKDGNATHSETSPVKSLYQSFVGSNRAHNIRSTIISLLTLYIVLYTLYYFFGLTHLSIYEFLIICVKIGIIVQLLRDDSWNFFYNNAFSMFINAPMQLIEVANFRGTTSNVFEFLDLPLNRFSSSHLILLIVSLIFSGPLGFVSFCLVIWGLIIVCLSICHALFSFITSIAIVALLLSLAPLFIICLLFPYTRQMFLDWVGFLTRFAIHPVVLLLFISLISQAMDYIIYSVFDFEVCTTCIFSINLKIWEPCILYSYASKYTPNITAMMAFVILGHAMKALIEASSTISEALSSTNPLGEPGRHYQQSLMGLVGLDETSVARREYAKQHEEKYGTSTGISQSSGGSAQKAQTPLPRPERK
ncbi:TrbL/VirB6 family protein [Wolbachia endosymbiont of Ctenocephalides felis wCfeT]|uniref:type IV secretion system protein n=1 Tax=Wolbachia endosymbiont of Ctenocephalides felis wCfeT TaxID=2732593 RepID=UPI001FEBB799|nr:type IV secretion system protein [Wolbachia endosymbiont of Ctenocephalides felis wCfeT]